MRSARAVERAATSATWVSKLAVKTGGLEAKARRLYGHGLPGAAMFREVMQDVADRRPDLGDFTECRRPS